MTRLADKSNYNISEKFRARIVQLKDEAGLKSSLHLAEYCGVSAPVVRKAVNFGIFPSLRSLIIIADKFNVSIPYLIGEADENHFVKAKKPSTFFDRFPELAGNRKYGKFVAEMGIPYLYIYEWMNDKTLPSLDFIMQIANYLQVSPDYVLGRTDEKN